MAQAGAQALTTHYRSLQKSWKVSHGEAYRRLVVPNGNSSQPFHRWFHLKEAYSSQLLPQLVSDSGHLPQQHLRVRDPYSGSGTTLLSALEAGFEHDRSITVHGTERNPFIWELAHSKVAGRIAGREAAKDFEVALDSVEALYRSSNRPFGSIPDQATLRNERYFAPDNVEKLCSIRHAIDMCAEGLSRSLLRVSLAAAVEGCGRLRRDGRALRFTPGRQPKDAWTAFSERAAVVLQDLEVTEPLDASGAVRLGDGRQCSETSTDFDWIVFSPPYPNNIDYTEVYKTEAWVLGCYETAQEMRAQRQLTVRSHPSIRFERDYSYLAGDKSDDVSRIIEPVISAVPKGKYYSGRVEVIRGYADDMLLTLQSCRRDIAPNGRLAFIVGNSAHASGDSAFIIAADVLMGALAELAGWRVTEVKIARELIRRNADSEFLRESVVMLEPA
ncbi:hypothetical protein [Streptomyces agglomeratus]|uniref:hypothetical protein n=1 Tax=Streptomyces agglomeratus TaxID=285458 RepID=UPI00114CF657|nr:hypothetical protein [Streptomyces agglomeratus]